MAKLRLLDPEKARLFSFTELDTLGAQAELLAKGWTNVEAMRHIDSAVDAGAYAKEETIYPTRRERVIRQAGESREEKK